MSLLPKISIIVPTYNNASFLADTIDSILIQNRKDIEIIVVDDGSEDDTRNVLNRYGHLIKYIYQENSGGASRPRNVGMMASQGEYICIFDSDDLMKAGKLNRQINFLDKNPRLSLVFTDFCDFDKDHIFMSHVSACTLFAQTRKIEVGDGEFAVTANDAFNTLFIENYVGTSSIMFRRSLLDLVGGFDESLAISEDMDFLFRASQATDFGYIDEVFHLRRLHDSNITRKSETYLNCSIFVLLKYCNQISSDAIRREIRKKVGDLYYSLGYLYRENDMYTSAFQAYWKSIKKYPLPNRAYLGALKTMYKSIKTK
ncbi:MAG: glycosyltransferase [Nitrososphaera sp.]|nr:glycosyltransferase [Nitrososphaera sp.]MCI0590559.1 glycosyltransferase [Gammaproteobacteria bacterium]